MKKAFIIIVCLASMMAAGTSLKAQQVTIPLMPGWTWISYPSTDTVDFATALGTFTPAEGDVIESQFDYSEYIEGSWLGGVQQFYPGYGYLYYSSRTMPVFLTFNAQQPSQQVVVTTDTPQFITAISAMGGGEVTTTDRTYIIVKGLCWATHENPTTNEDSFVEDGSGVGSFSATMTGLNLSTTYYVRAYAVTPSGTVYGEQQSFTTRDGIPTLTTDSITSITAISATSGGTITDDGGLSVTARGVCWSTSPNPTVSDSHTSNGTGTGSFTSSITNLEVSTTYYVRAYATTNAGTAYGNELTFTTRDGIPTVTTAEVTDIQGETAICGGNVTDNCGLAVIARGVCWSTSPIPTLDDSHTTNGSGMGSFSSSITGLSISTTYYVRAYATTSAGTAYGEEVSFTTRDGIPTVTTAEVTNIQGETATCGGNVTDNCGLTIIVRGVCWSTSQNPTFDDSHTTNGSGMGSFSSSITGLSISTTYYVRAYATTSAGTGYGEQVSFTTRNGIPTVTTADVTNIQGETATCGGNVTDNCGLMVTARGVCWSTSPNPTIDDSHTTNGSGMGSFSSSITGLTISTTYYVRAYATTSAGTGYGEQGSFTTRNGIPNVTTVEVTNIGSAWAYCGGNITDNGGLAIIARGVCWGTSPSPTLADSHTTNDNGSGVFSSYITGLDTSTTYFVRAYATNNYVTVYGNQFDFTTTNDEKVYVDLGLPSGTLWAACNVGAITPEGYGDYYSWGETQPKDVYYWSTYQYCNGTYTTLTKYCSISSYGYNGFTDSLTNLVPEDDVVTINWGSDWRMPTEGEWRELINNTTSSWITQNGVCGRLFTAPNGNTLFLPSSGYYNSGGFNQVDIGHYWSSSLSTNLPSTAWHFDFYSNSYGGGYGLYDQGGARSQGLSVRPVRSFSQD